MDNSIHTFSNAGSAKWAKVFPAEIRTLSIDLFFALENTLLLDQILQKRKCFPHLSLKRAITDQFTFMSKFYLNSEG